MTFEQFAKSKSYKKGTWNYIRAQECWEAATASHPAPAQKVVPVAEPVAWRRKEKDGWWVYYETKAWPDLEPLFAAQPILAQDAKDARSDSVHLAGGAGGNVHAPGAFKNSSVGPTTTGVSLALVCENCGKAYGVHFGPKCPDAAILSSKQSQAGGGGRGV